jgi:hypothetical protein
MTRDALLLAALALGWLAGGGAPQGPQSLPFSKLPVQLTGLMLDNSAPAKSACLIRCLTPPERRGMFFPGDRACDLVEIREVRVDGVVVHNLVARRTEFLVFAAVSPQLHDPAALSAAAAPPATASALVAVDVPKAAIERQLANLPDLLASALGTPRYKDGPGGQRVVDGFEISQVRSGGAADQVGLRDGDVITDVNGQPLDGMATVMRLFGQVSLMTQIKMTVLRRGQVLTFVVTTK